MTLKLVKTVIIFLRVRALYLQGRLQQVSQSLISAKTCTGKEITILLGIVTFVEVLFAIVLALIRAVDAHCEYCILWLYKQYPN